MLHFLKTQENCVNQMISNVTIQLTAWQNNRVRKETLFIKFDCHIDTATVDLSAGSEGHNPYTLKRSYPKNKSSGDAKKFLPYWKVSEFSFSLST